MNVRRTWWLAPVLIAGCGHAGQGSKPPSPAPGACPPVPAPAAAVLHAFRDRLWAQAAQDPTAFVFSFPDTVEAFARENRAILAEQAQVRFLGLPKLEVPDLDALPDDRRASGEVAERIRQLIADRAPDRDSPRPTQLIRLATNLTDRFQLARAFALGWNAVPSGGAHVREQMIDLYAPAQIVRLNDDPGHPVLALPKRNDLFVIWFVHQDAGGDLPGRIRWVRRKTPEEPPRVPRDADEVARAISLDMQSVAIPDTVRDQDLGRYLDAQNQAIRERWIPPHKDLLRQQGACAFLRLPLQPLPDLAAWQDASDQWTPAAILPRQVWNAETMFEIVRTLVTIREHSATEALTMKQLFDGVAPPLLTRANSDPDHPVLALVENGTALIVTLRISDQTGYSLESVKYARRGPVRRF